MKIGTFIYALIPAFVASSNVLVHPEDTPEAHVNLRANIVKEMTNKRIDPSETKNGRTGSFSKTEQCFACGDTQCCFPQQCCSWGCEMTCEAPDFGQDGSGGMRPRPSSAFVAAPVFAEAE